MGSESHVSFREAFGRALWEYRTFELKMTAREVAEILEVTTMAYRTWERGIHSPQLVRLHGLGFDEIVAILRRTEELLG
jgi:transcriptional regulator with XRE-family HTH domain